MRFDAFYSNPRLSALAVVFILLLGSVAFNTLARQEDPSMVERWARVNTFLPGATAERMESLISEPIETALREVPEVKELSSVSKAGLSVVNVELYDSVGGEQVDAIWSEIRDELADVAAKLPGQASEPELIQNKPLASTVIVKVGWNQDGPPQLNLMSRVAESLRLRLANLPGTEIAETWGEAEEEILVAVDPYLLAEANMAMDQIAATIRGADTKIPAGRLRGAQTDLLVEVEAELDSPERIARIPLRRGESGAVLRVSDVATVSKFRKTPPESMALHRGQPVVLVNAKMQPGRQIGTWAEQALQVVEEYAIGMPPGISVDIVYSQLDYTGARMRNLGENLVFALVIVLVLLIWFMGARSALTVGVALPLSAGMVLAGMQFMEIPLHQMSVTGLIISLGLLIDNAIVVVEDFKLRRSKGHAIDDSIRHAVRHLLIPLGASTATTVLAFMPIALAPGGVGDFTGTIGVTVALSVVSSFALAMTVVPAFAGMLEKFVRPNQKKTWWHNGFSNERLTGLYANSLRAVITRPWKGVLVACVLPFLGFGLAHTLTQQFFPPVDRNQFQVQVALPTHASIQDTQAAVARVDALLREHPDVHEVYWAIGKGAPRVFYNVISLNERVVSFASGWVNTTSAEATKDILPGLQRKLMDALPEAEVLALPFEQGPPASAPVEVRIVGPDLEVLRERAGELRGILASVPSVTYTRSTMYASEPKLAFTPYENSSAAAGLATGDLSRRLNAALSGEPAGTVQEGNTELMVRVRVDDRYRNDVADLSTMPMLGAAGRGVPLDELGTWQIVPTMSQVERHQGSRVSNVQAYLVPFTLPAAVLTDFTARIEAAGFELPAGYELQIGGEAEQSSESIGNILSVFLFCVLAMAAVVVLSLNSFKQAGLIGLVAVLSFGLALFGVRLFGYPFGYMALIGSLGMMGLAINGAIIVLSALKASADSVAGDQEAMVDVVVDATRHIVSTTATTIGGFVPLIADGGTFWPPLATAIAGGVGGSALIAL